MVEISGPAMGEMSRSERELALTALARRVLPGGSFGNLSSDIVIAKGLAGRVWDVSGNEYVDYLLGSGPMFVATPIPPSWRRCRPKSPWV